MKYENEFRKDSPETVGENDKHFDLSNYVDWVDAELQLARQLNNELLEATKELLALLRFLGYQHAKVITIAQELIQKHSTP